MNKLKVLIVDDEPIQRKIMHEYCVQSTFFDVIIDAKDAVQALELLNTNTFDLVLLDINMPLLSGLSLASSLNNSINIIFVTAYAEHAIDAFDLNVIDYLLKPVSFERFIKAIQKIKIQNNQQIGTFKDYIILKQNKKSIKLVFDDILYCESKGNNTRFYLIDNTSIDIYTTLNNILNQLPKDIFIQIHRSFIVNNKKINALENNLLYINEISLPIGKNYKEEVLKVFGV